MRTRNRKIENIIYIGLWLVVIVLYLLDAMQIRHSAGKPLLDTTVLSRMTLSLLPFLALFLVNNILFIPRLLLHNRYKAYLSAAGALLIAVWMYQTWTFYFHFINYPKPPGHGPTPLVPLPVLLSLVYDLLIVGANLAIALIFQRFEDRLERESLQKAHAENQLAYLKAQINPHFHMNMLNNIHGMIEIDAEKAQEMVIDMSNLMRYMLYDSSNDRIALSSEIAFLKNYLRLMRQRYPEDRVKITVDFPSESAVSGVMIPPLLFLVFIENSFKHGISYRDDSFVSVRIEVQDNRVIFTCLNSVHPSADNHGHDHGIGLKNIRERLRLIYGDKARCDIRTTASTYLVNLSIPTHETADPHN